MTLYLDSSAFLKLYLSEPESAACEELLNADREWTTARHTEIEVRRALARELRGAALTASRGEFATDWESTSIIELDQRTCSYAAELAEVTGARTLDALHLAAATRAGNGVLPFLTYDLRQAQIARSLGWSVLGT